MNTARLWGRIASVRHSVSWISHCRRSEVPILLPPTLVSKTYSFVSERYMVNPAVLLPLLPVALAYCNLYVAWLYQALYSILITENPTAFRLHLYRRFHCLTSDSTGCWHTWIVSIHPAFFHSSQVGAVQIPDIQLPLQKLKNWKGRQVSLPQELCHRCILLGIEHYLMGRKA